MPNVRRASPCRGALGLGWALLAGLAALSAGPVRAQMLEARDGSGAFSRRGPWAFGSETIADSVDGKAPGVTIHDVSGKPGQVIALTPAVPSMADGDLPSVYLLNVPHGAIVADAAHAVVVDHDRATVDVTGWNAAALTIAVPAKETRSYLLGLVALSHPDDGGPVRTAQAAFTLAITAEARADAEPATDMSPRAMSVPPSDGGVPEGRRSTADPAKPSDTSADIGSVARPDVPSGLAPQHAGLPPRSEARPEAADRSAPASPSSDGRALLERAARLIKLGDISGARLVLERGMARGDRKATYLLAQTYDPKVLRSWNVQGLRPDPARAGVLYDAAARAEPADPRLTADARR